MRLSRHLRISRYLFNIEIKIIGFIIEILVIFLYTIMHYTEHKTVMTCVSNFGNNKICIILHFSIVTHLGGSAFLW